MVQQSKLLSLPVEVYGMIQEELFRDSTVVTRDIVLRNQDHLDARKFTYRADILRPIMHICRALRATYVSAYYEHLEVCMVRTGRVWYKQLSERLERMSRVLMAPEMKDLAALVSVITVCLTRCNEKAVLPLFATCLFSLPNLHTLQVMHAHSQMTTSLKSAFEGKKYPQIRTVILPSCAHNILRSCPEVRDVTCNEDDGSKLLGAILKECRKVEVVQNIHMDSLNAAKRFRKAFPCLREVTFHYISLDMIKELVGLRNLTILRLHQVFFTNNEAAPLVYPQLEESVKIAEAETGCVGQAKIILAKSRQKGKYVEVEWQVCKPDRSTTDGILDRGYRCTAVLAKRYPVE